jgi:hypothetical protein
VSDNHHSQTADIRLAKPRDGDEMARMSRRLIEYGLPWWCWTPKRVAKAIRSSATVAIVADVGKPVAGFAVMYYVDKFCGKSVIDSSVGRFGGRPAPTARRAT